MPTKGGKKRYSRSRSTKGTRSKSRKGHKIYETYKQSKYRNEKQFTKLFGRKTGLYPLFPYVGGNPSDKGGVGTTHPGGRDYTTKKGDKDFHRIHNDQSLSRKPYRKEFTEEKIKSYKPLKELNIKGGSKRPRRKHTRKYVPWKGWSRNAPKGKQRTRMYRKCGKKCFLGTKISKNKQHPNFPICSKGTCTINNKGVWAAYVRARQWGKPKRTYKGKSKPRMKQKYYTRVANKAKRILTRKGFKVGKKTKRRQRP